MRRKGTSVYMNKLKKEVMSALNSLIGEDRLVLRKKLDMSDTVCLKSDPSRAVWKSDVSCGVDMCLALVCVGAAVLAAVMLTVHGIKKLCRRRG